MRLGQAGALGQQNGHPVEVGAGHALPGLHVQCLCIRLLIASAVSINGSGQDNPLASTSLITIFSLFCFASLVCKCDYKTYNNTNNCTNMEITIEKKF